VQQLEARHLRKRKKEEAVMKASEIEQERRT